MEEETKCSRAEIPKNRMEALEAVKDIVMWGTVKEVFIGKAGISITLRNGEVLFFEDKGNTASDTS